MILGGQEIPYECGLLGHSDADVLTHAVIDALLGGAGLWDIGHAFPDTDAAYKDISSLVLLKWVKAMLDDKKLRVGNVDVTVIAQRPKLAHYIPAMRETLAEILQIPADRMNIKATTEEGLGFSGRQEGIACHAVALLEE